MNLPEKQLLRRGEVRAYLGVDEHVMKQIIGAGTLTPVYLTGKKGRAFFKRVDVVKLTSASALPGGSQTNQTTGSGALRDRALPKKGQKG